jgi:hypothetical protein
MYRRPGGPERISLRDAVATVHRDPRWWIKCLTHGGLTLSLLGAPIAAGFVLESYDNSRKGYPTPLPPWSDWTIRWLSGLFALLIDFTFFVLPLLIAGMLVVCAGIGLLAVVQSDLAALNTTLIVILTLAGVVAAGMFFVGVAPVGRLIFVDEGKIEEALSVTVLRRALDPAERRMFLRARLTSLGAYVPVLAIGGGSAALFISMPSTPIWAVALGAWLLCSTLVYAHLVTAQLYVAAEHIAEQQRNRWE